LSISSVLERLGYLRFEKRDYAKAAGVLERSLAIREKLFGGEDPRTADTLVSLANVYQVARHYDKAEPLYIRGLTIREKKLGASNPKTIEGMKNFACSELLSRPPSSWMKDADQSPDEKKALIHRAFCWLGELEDKCGEATVKPQGLLNGKAVTLGRPVYPAEARRAQASGTIFVAVLIDERGTVIKARSVCGGHAVLAASSVAAALLSKFTPTLVDGRPVQVTGMITYRFIRE
jgi:TonB family protein